MTLRKKLLLWFAVLHAIFAIGAAFLIAQNRMLLFAVEALFVISAIISYRLVRALFVPLDLIATGAELMNERDFSSHFVAVGQPELDRLISIYNAMIDRLREERLVGEEQHQLLQKIIEASPAGVVICDYDGNIQQMNPAAERLLKDQPLPDVSTSETRMITLGGARRVKVWRREFRDRGFVKSFYLLEELTEELRESEKTAYEKLIRMMSHEVNNSVGAVRSLLESLLGDISREDFEHAVTIASNRLNSLNRFMTGFADVVRIPPPHLREVDMAALIASTAALVRPELEKRGIALRTDLAPDGALRIDPHQIEQVLINVLRNAMEAVGNDGAIEVRWLDRVLTVTDTGPGIDDAAKQQLFTPFFTTKRDGRGLGLTVIQEILTNHGATFWLENRAGGGAEFGVRFGVQQGQ